MLLMLTIQFVSHSFKTCYCWKYKAHHRIFETANQKDSQYGNELKIYYAVSIKESIQTSLQQQSSSIGH